MEQRKSHTDAKRKAQLGERPIRPNTDAVYDDGLSRSSGETSVMGVKRRTVVQLELSLPTPNNRGMNSTTPTRGIPITKEMVWDAYKKAATKTQPGSINKP